MRCGCVRKRNRDNSQSARRDKHDHDGVHEKVQKLDESEFEMLAEIIAQKVYEKKEQKESREKEAYLQKQFWGDGNDFL